ncbi:MAG TPA: YcxB family protein [Candidatus Angelobacter sp.]
MKAEFQLTADDYVDAQRTHMRKTLGKKKVLIFAFYAFAGILYIWAFIDRSPQLFLQLRPFGYVALGSAVLIAGICSGIPYRWQFREIQALHSTFTIEAGPEGLNFTGARGQSQARWEAFEDFRESKTNFLIYTQPRLFFVIPKRALQPEDTKAFRELAQTHIGSKPR